MIKRIYKRIKFIVDSISTAQKLFALLALLGASIAGNFYQHGKYTELSSKPHSVNKLVCEKEIITKPVFIDKVIEKRTHEVIIKYECPKGSIKGHEKEYHT